MIVEQAREKCAHESCVCEVVEGQRYCSTHCEQAATQPADSAARCGCGHAACDDAHVGGGRGQPAHV